MNLALPFQFDRRGRTAESAEPRYVRDLIEAVLFTAPGERVMRPEFGSGIAQLVFAPNSPELAATTRVLVQGSLTRWLGDLITVTDVSVEAHESTLRVTVVYALRGSERAHVETFEQKGGL